MEKRKDFKTIDKLWKLFTTTFSISATTSGGYAIISIMKQTFVEKYHWFTNDEMLDYVSIAQSAPGAIAINASIIVGYKVAGFLGALVTTLGTILPPLVIMSLVTVFYDQFSTNAYIRNFMLGMQAGVAGLLISVTLDLFIDLKKKKSILLIIVAIISFILAKFTNISFGYLAIGCIIIGLIKTLIMRKDIK